MDRRTQGVWRNLQVLEWLGNYRRIWLKGDIIAGLTAAAVVIPNAKLVATGIANIGGALVGDKRVFLNMEQAVACYRAQSWP